MVKEKVQIGALFKSLLDDGYVPTIHKDCYEVIECHGIQILTYGNKFVDLLKISRHKTTKNLLKIEIDGTRNVIITTDHVCMRYDRDRVFENVDAKDLNLHDYVSIYDEINNVESLGSITAVHNLGTTNEYVYDCEVADDMHAFYANDILIHNSQFIPLNPIVDKLIAQHQLPEKIADWPQNYRQELWNIMSKFTDEKINEFVRDAVHKNFKTNNQNVLTYELEYMVDVGLYESMKHYFVHKIFEEGDAVDKAKVTGISLKKNETDKSMKNFLKDIYEGVVIKDWTEHDYQDYISSLYEKFKQFSIDEVSFWKGYGSARDSIGFLQMAKGATQISRACTYYNHIIAKMGLGKQYDTLRVGDKCRFTYIKPTNKYGINCIAYKPGSWPKEFNGIFEVDYSTMFDKIILDQLKRFREACHFEDIDPRKQVMQDVFEL